MADMDVTAKFRADISDMRSKMDQISRSLSGMQKSTQKASGGFTVLKGAIGTAFGGAIIGGIYAAGRALGGLATDSIDAASTMEELQSKVNAIFGPQAGAEIAAWSATASSAFGQSQISAQNAASTFAIFGKGAGLAGSDLVGFSTGLTELSSDLASFYDASPEEAIGAIGAALRGETEPIRRFGVMLDDASMREQAFAMGLTKTTKDALKPQQRALAAQALIMQQTSDAQGDFARTSDGLANSQRTLSAVIEDVKAQVGTALLPAITSIVQAIAPVIQQLSGPLAQVAGQLGTVLTQAFQALGPAIGPLVGVLSNIVEIVGGALTSVLATLIPALMPLLDVFTQMASLAGPLFAAILQKVADILARVLGAIIPLLGPLTDLVFGILNAAWPIIELVADVLLLLVDAIAPLLSSVVALLVPLGELVEVLLAAILPIIKPLLPVIKALAEVLADVLGRAIALLMAGIGGLIVAFSKLAPFILRNVTKPVVTAFLNMAKGVVGAAATMLGWVPGLGDKLRAAESAISTFATQTEVNIGNAADAIEAEGGRIGNEMILQGTRALAAAGPALGAAAAATGRYVAGQYSAAMEEGMRSVGIGARPAAPPPPAPLPPLAPSGGGSSTGATAEKDTKAVDQIVARLQKWKDGLDKVIEARKTISESTERPFANILGDLSLSQIQTAFGKDGSVSSAIGEFKNLSGAIDDFYKPLLNVDMFGKKAVNAAKAAMRDTKSFLASATATALNLMKQRELNKKALTDLDSDYAKATVGINKTYDALDKAAADNLKAIEDRWAAAIPPLEQALSRATAAYEKENAVLNDLITKRDGFLSGMASSARSFLNALSFPLKQAAKEIKDAIPEAKVIRTIKDFANGLRVTIEEEIAPAMKAVEEATGEQALTAGDIGAALNDRLTAIRDFATNIRTLMQRGLDPTLVQDFVSAGVSGAGAAAAALVSASDSEIAGINAAQSGLAAEIASFQQYSSAQWFDAGIAQQEAIVAPLAAAKDAAQFALDTANTLRNMELNNARLHQEQLKADREAALASELANYTARKDALIAEGVDIDNALQANADAVNAKFESLTTTLPPKMQKIGTKAIQGLIDGLNDEKYVRRLMNRARSLGEAVAAELRKALQVASPSRVTEKIGEQVAQGLAVGMDSSGRMVSESASNLGYNAIPQVPSAPAAAASTNIVINIDTGIATDPADVGRQVVEAIRKYERRSGPVFVNAR